MSDVPAALVFGIDLQMMPGRGRLDSSQRKGQFIVRGLLLPLAQFIYLDGSPGLLLPITVLDRRLENHESVLHFDVSGSARKFENRDAFSKWIEGQRKLNRG